MIVKTRALLTLVGAMLATFASLSHAQSNPDVDAAARSVVRVVVVDENNPDGAGLGMGSGVAITPNRIVTNAHVVEGAVERGAFVGIVPSEGRKRFAGRVVAYAPDLDLAIIAIDSGRVEPAALFAGLVPDGTAVAALGYPAGVDRAMASAVDEVIRPQSPIKSLGHVGGRRSNARFDAVLHDASIGRGNSGGPLIDTCGRVIGINSFLSISEGIDNPLAFALSVKELLPFLARAKVVPAVVTAPCLSGEEARARALALGSADADASAEIARKSEIAARRVATEKQRLRDEIATERDNGIALAAGLLVFGALALGGAIALAGRGQRRPAWLVAALGGALVLGAVLVFLARPKPGDAEDRYAALQPAKPLTLETAIADGPLLCTIDAARSRITVSKTDDVPLDWRADGCVNGRTQYGANAGLWSRSFVPNGEATVTIQSFDPAKARYTVDRYLLPAETMEAARAVRARYRNDSCSADPAARASVAEMESAVRALLPPAPNERLVYACRSNAEPNR